MRAVGFTEFGGPEVLGIVSLLNATRATEADGLSPAGISRFLSRHSGP